MCGIGCGHGVNVKNSTFFLGNFSFQGAFVLGKTIDSNYYVWS